MCVWVIAIYTEFYFNQETLFRELPESAQHKLGDQLMAESAWKLVAAPLGFTSVDIETLAAKYVSDAAYKMLREWSRRNGSTLRVLRRTLAGIEQRDIVTFLDDVCKR